MPLPEGYLPREGDELLIRVKVSYDVQPHDRDVHARPIGQEHRKFMIPLDEVHALYCRSWNVDDRVSCGEFEGAAEVVAVCDSYVWVKDRMNQMWTVEANDLEPYVEPEAPLETMRNFIEAAIGAPKPDMVALGEAIAFNYPNCPPPPAPGSQSAVGDDDEIKF